MTKLFISYRREDTKYQADLLHKILCSYVSAENVFIDVRDIPPGEDFPSFIDAKIAQCDVLLALIGPKWLGARDPQDASPDYVQIEIRSALKRNVKVVPILFDNAAVPEGDLLPDDLQALARRNSVEVRRIGFEDDVDRLLRGLGLEKRTSASAEGPSESLRVSIERLPESRVSNLVGREAALNVLDDCWSDRHVHICCLVGFGGVGKSTLVQHWLAQLATRDYAGAHAVFAWSFEGQSNQDQEASADAFVSEALKFFGADEPPVNARERGLCLAQLVRAQPSVLVLDGIEALQLDEDSPLRDQAVSALLKSLASQNPRGLCVVTTRRELAELKPFVGKTVRTELLGGLSLDAGAQLLRDLGVKGPDLELRTAVEEYRGHALFLTLLGSWLKSWKSGDIRCRNELEMGEPDGARRMMTSYEKMLGQGPELETLSVLGVFNRPAPLAAISAIRAEPPIANLTDNLVKLRRSDWDHTVHRLRDLKLILDPQRDLEGAELNLDAHAIVRNHFSQKLRQEHPDAWVEANRRLFEFYRQRPLKHRPDTFEEMAELFQAVTHGCRAGEHENAWSTVYWPRIRRENDGYSATVLGASGADLVALSGFFRDGDWASPIEDLSPEAAAQACTEAGFDLRGLGRLEEAIEALEAGLARHKALNAAWRACDCAGNLSETLALHGQLGRAKVAAEESISLARIAMEQATALDARFEAQQTLSTNLATLADTLHQRGDIDEAERMFAEAERVLRETDPNIEYLGSLHGFYYCDALLTLGRIDDAHRRARYAEETARANQRRYPLGLAQLTLARVFALRNDPACAREYVELAREELRKSGFLELIVRALLWSAQIHVSAADFDAARAELEEVLEVASSASMRLLETDAHVQLAALEAALGNISVLRTQLEVARRKVKAFGYKRWEARLEDLAALSENGSSGGSVSNAAAHARFDAAQAAFLEAYLMLDPVAGTELGVPGDHDTRLPPVVPAVREQYLTHLESCARELAAAATVTGGLDDQIDGEFASAGIRGMRIVEDALCPPQKNPGFYIEGTVRGVYALLARSDLEYEEKIEPLVGRLRSVPEFLDEAKARIVGAASVLVTNAIGDAEGATTFLRDDCRDFLARAPRGISTAAAEHALTRAEAALANFIQYLRRIRGAGEAFALGHDEFYELLRELHMVRLSPRELRDQGHEIISGIEARLKAAGRGAFGHERWWQAIELLEKRPPTQESLLDDYRWILAQAREFVQKHDFVGLAQVGTLVVQATPPFARANLPFAAYIAAPPFARSGRSEFWVSPPSQDLPLSRKEDAFRRHHKGRMVVACVHEGYPGHHVQFAHAAHVKRPVRHLFASNVFSEGWGLYCEDLMRREGFLLEEADGKLIEISLLRDQLWRAMRIVIDVGLHCFGMRRHEAVKMLVKSHVLDKASAEAEVMYYCSAPTQPMSYMIGQIQMEDAIARCRRMRGGSMPVGRVRDDVLAHGSIPFPLLERALGLDQAA